MSTCFPPATRQAHVVKARAWLGFWKDQTNVGQLGLALGILLSSLVGECNGRTSCAHNNVLRTGRINIDRHPLKNTARDCFWFFSIVVGSIHSTTQFSPVQFISAYLSNTSTRGVPTLSFTIYLSCPLIPGVGRVKIHMLAASFLPRQRSG